MKRLLLNSATGLLLLAFFSASLAEEKIELTETDKAVNAKRAEINALLKEIQKGFSEADALYIDAKNEAVALKTEYENQKEVLEKVLSVAAKSARFTGDEVSRARDLKKASDAAAEKYKYRPALNDINKALTLVAVQPVVSLNITPRTISNNFEKMRFDIDFTSPRAEIASWEVNVYNVDADNEIVVKTWKGEGTPPSVFEWDGTLNDEFLLDSAGDYAVEAFAIDVNGERGSSGKVPFKTDVFAREAERGLVIDVSSIEFEVDRAELKEEHLPVVKKIYNFLIEYPEYNIIVEGHSDNDGKASYNKWLSNKRAESVMQQLIKAGLSENRVSASGLGEALPKTEYLEKRALNRRVVFILIRNEDALEDYNSFVEDLSFYKETRMKKAESE